MSKRAKNFYKWIVFFVFFSNLASAYANNLTYQFSVDETSYHQLLSKSDGYISFRCNNIRTMMVNDTRLWLVPGKSSFTKDSTSGTYTATAYIDTKDYQKVCKEQATDAVTISIVLSDPDPSNPTSSVEYFYEKTKPGSYKLDTFYIPKIILDSGSF